jgi:homoserine O-succinyltransferase
MPINIPDHLPAKKTLQGENIFVLDEQCALHQDIRPLRIAIVNLMPKKIATETQLLRLLSNTPLQIETDLIMTGTYRPKNTAPEHLACFYKTFREISSDKYDGLIVTGAPVEHFEFEEVAYWKEIQEIFNWAETHVTSTMFICWAAQAALYHHYGIRKYPLSQKMSGVFDHYLLDSKPPVVRGFDEFFKAPHSRNTGIRREDILNESRILLLAESEEAGPYLIAAANKRRIFVTGHPEYDIDTLKGEYLRDKDKGLEILPEHYFPFNDPTKEPQMRWRGHAHLLFSNWLNYYVYQETPYNIHEIN